MRKITLLMLMLVAAVMASVAQNTPASQMEKLDRGLVAVPLSSSSAVGRLVSWRILGTDDMKVTTFDLIRNGEIIATDLKVSNYSDTYAPSGSKYQVVTKVNGEVINTSEPVTAWSAMYKKLVLDRPAAGVTKPYTTTNTVNKVKVTESYPDGQEYTYSPNDCSLGDVDGDGEYEIFVKWEPSNSRDNSQNGVTGIVYIDCYKLDGTKLWRVDLGQNIRAGAHYTQFQVYDYNGDGKAELICKTAPGSRDSKGNYVNQAATDANIRAASNTKDWTSEGAGRVNGGHEYLTVFNGETGEAIHTIAYYPNRNAEAALSDAAGTSFNWDDRSGKSDYGSYGNRGERYLAATAYLDGPDKNPSGIFTRGYYTYAYIWAVDFDGQYLKSKWLHRSDAKNSYSVLTYDEDGNYTEAKYSGLKSTSGSGSATMYGNGNHNLSIGDVDGDGCDEIIWGSAGLDNDGKMLYGTGFGHGDAIHIGQMIPGREGMQVFEVHEEKGTYAWDLHDAATGEIIYKGGPSGVDNGRGMAAQLSAKDKSWWFASASERQQRSASTGEVASTASGSTNFRIYWDGVLQDQLLDGNTLEKYNDDGNSFSRLVTFYNLGPGSTCNGSKNTPNLQADIFGDWREELVLYSVTDEETYLGIYSTNIETKYPVSTLMHDHTYRMGICWQNSAYNQPPHLGYNLALAWVPGFVSEADTIVEQNKEFSFTLKAKNVSKLALYKSITPSGKSKLNGMPTGMSRSIDNTEYTITFKGTPSELGDYKFIVTLTEHSGATVRDTVTVHVTEETVTVMPGDVNNDGSVTMNDANSVVNYFLADAAGKEAIEQSGDFNKEAANVVNDDEITMSDANGIVSIFLNSASASEEQ